MKDDEIRRELDSLAAETMALQVILINVLRKSLAVPYAAQIVIPSLDEAADFVENYAIMQGKRASPGHTVKALEIVERLRAAVVGDERKPKPGV